MCVHLFHLFCWLAYIGVHQFACLWCSIFFLMNSWVKKFLLHSNSCFSFWKACCKFLWGLSINITIFLQDVHERYRTESHSEAAGRFNERFLLSVASCRACVVMDDEFNILPISSHIKSITPVPVKEVTFSILNICWNKC